jgi:hypothetical protein
VMSLMGGRRSRGFGGAKLRWPAGAGRSKLAARAGSWPELGALSGRIWRELRKGATAGRRGGGDFWRIRRHFTEMAVGAARYRSGMAGAGFGGSGWGGGGGAGLGRRRFQKTTTAVRVLMGFLEVFWGWNTNNDGERHLVH